MAIDRTKHKNKQSGTKVRLLFSVSAAFLLGYLFASIYAWQDVYMLFEKHVMSTTSQQTPPSPTQARPNLPKPQFEFYTLLSEDKSSSGDGGPTPFRGSVPKVKPKAPAQQAIPVSTGNSVSAVKSIYLVQVASFRGQADAERMKASLILKDFNARITAVKRHDGAWYRVMIGPYTSKIEAEKAQVAIARSEHIMGMIRKMDA